MKTEFKKELKFLRTLDLENNELLYGKPLFSYNGDIESMKKDGWVTCPCDCYGDGSSLHSPEKHGRCDMCEATGYYKPETEEVKKRFKLRVRLRHLEDINKAEKYLTKAL